MVNGFPWSLVMLRWKFRARTGQAGGQGASITLSLWAILQAEESSRKVG